MNRRCRFCIINLIFSQFFFCLGYTKFAEVSKIVEAGATNKPVKDYELTRYACYLIVQNGDPRKEVIALGQTYFAIQTYRQEVADHFNELSEDNRRLVVRGDIKQWNQMLAETAHKAGVITNEEFAIFQNAGYMGLYGGLDVDDIHTKKGLEVGQKILIILYRLIRCSCFHDFADLSKIVENIMSTILTGNHCSFYHSSKISPLGVI